MAEFWDRNGTMDSMFRANEAQPVTVTNTDSNRNGLTGLISTILSFFI